MSRFEALEGRTSGQGVGFRWWFAAPSPSPRLRQPQPYSAACWAQRVPSAHTAFPVPAPLPTQNPVGSHVSCSIFTTILGKPRSRTESATRACRASGNQQNPLVGAIQF